MKVNGWAGQLRVSVRLAMVLALFAAIVSADYFTGVDLALRALYVVPVALGAWYVRASAGFAFALLGAGACVVFDLRAGLGHTRRLFLYSDGAMRALTYLGIALIVDRLRVAYRRLGALAHTDALTALANVRGFRERAQRELDRARRTGAPFTLVHLDIDGFKAINDSRGHAEGDAVLVAVADVLRSGRAIDIPARIGGDEFVLLLPETSRSAAEQVLARIRCDLDDSMSARGRPVTFSIGAATFLEAPESVDRALKVADALMYSVKHGSKDSVTFAEISRANVSSGRGDTSR